LAGFSSVRRRATQRAANGAHLCVSKQRAPFSPLNKKANAKKD
jgi:hypothetical protein